MTAPECSRIFPSPTYTAPLGSCLQHGLLQHTPALLPRYLEYTSDVIHIVTVVKKEIIQFRQRGAHHYPNSLMFVLYFHQNKLNTIKHLEFTKSHLTGFFVNCGWSLWCSGMKNGEGDFSLPAWGRERRRHRYPAFYMSGRAANGRRRLVSLVTCPPITRSLFSDAQTNGLVSFFRRRVFHNNKRFDVD